jgi:hypothetical protein
MYQISVGSINWNHQTLKQAIAINCLAIASAWLSYYAFKQYALRLSKRRKANNATNYSANKISNCRPKVSQKVLDTLITQNKGNNQKNYSQKYPANVFKKVAHYFLSFFYKYVKG